jgi:hypothetical protein
MPAAATAAGMATANSVPATAAARMAAATGVTTTGAFRGGRVGRSRQRRRKNKNGNPEFDSRHDVTRPVGARLCRSPNGNALNY